MLMNDALLGGGIGPNVTTLNFKTGYVTFWVNAYVPVVILHDFSVDIIFYCVIISLFQN